MRTNLTDDELREIAGHLDAIRNMSSACRDKDCMAGTHGGCIWARATHCRRTLRAIEWARVEQRNRPT